MAVDIEVLVAVLMVADLLGDIVRHDGLQDDERGVGRQLAIAGLSSRR